MAKKNSRGVRGKGTCFKRGGVWIAKKPVGRTPAGKTLYVQRNGATQAEALARLAGALPPGPTTTVSQWATRWLESAVKRPRTMAIRRNVLTRHVVPTLGAIKVAALTARQVEEAAAKWGKTLESSSVRQAMAVLHTCLEAARRAGLCEKNPVGLAVRPKATRKKIDPFTPDELSRIVAEATARRSCRALALLAATGCRVGEVLALDANEFDPAAGTVSINRTISTDKSHADGPPKSSNGVRTIRVPLAAFGAVRDAHAGRASGPLFPSATGRRGTHNLAHKAWVGLCRRLGLRFRNLHQLRHSVATMMIAAGDPVADVAAYLGDTVETLIRTYLHATGFDPSRTMDRLLLDGGKVTGDNQK